MVEINKNARLSEHFTLAEMCKTNAKTADGNIPSHVQPLPYSTSAMNRKKISTNCCWNVRLAAPTGSTSPSVHQVRRIAVKSGSYRRDNSMRRRKVSLPPW